jgi:hypothetical protein
MALGEGAVASVDITLVLELDRAQLGTELASSVHRTALPLALLGALFLFSGGQRARGELGCPHQEDPHE